MEKLQQWQKVKEIVGSALERPAAERPAYLDQVCSGDMALRKEVESLLAAYPDSGTLSKIPWAISALVTDEISPARFVPGTLLAKRYRIVAPVGQGGMGEVYRAEDLRLGQTVALKFLPKILAHNPEAWSRVVREVRIARQISHPNVCRVFDMGESNEGPFLAMEFIDGEDLASLLRRIGRLHADKGLQVAHQLCTGLAAAHELGIVHRDLKPANIMIDGRGRVRITDFGLAALVEELRKEQVLAGTPGYMAPEQVSGGKITSRTDVYAAGLVLYELFSGRQAFPMTKALDQHRPTPVRLTKIIDGFDPAIERIVNRCLDPNPEARPSAPEVASGLPGGDPLRAAIEAGETPSPETVAASGGSVVMSTGVSVGLFLAVFLGIAVSASLGRYANWLNAVHGGKPPEALAERARELVTRFGYDENAADTAWWMEVNHSSTRADRGSPDSILFFYRQSPRPMIPGNLFSDIDSNHPAEDVPGMISVVLDARGRLREFSALPTPVEKHDAQAPEWSALLLEAGLSSAQLASEFSAVIPPLAYDLRQDWQAIESGKTTVITAAAYNGKVVYFRTALSGTEPRQSTEGSGLGTLSDIMFVVAAAVCGIGGWLVARRNMRRGRGDRQGAFRVALFIFTGEFVGWALAAHFVSNAWDDYWTFVAGCGEALYMAGFMWVLYMAIEPYMRRRWPETLISWTRVLNGKPYDRRVGRDVMLGALGGVGMAIIQNGVNAMPAWFHVANIEPIRTSHLTLGSPAGMVSALGYFSNLAVQWALATGAFLVVARFLMRRDWLAVVVSAVSLGLVVLAGNNLIVAVPAAMLCAAIVYTLLFRFGLLSVAVTLFFYFVLRRWPVTLDFSQWFVWRSIFSLSILVAIAVYAWLAINIGRSIFSESADEA
jgi:serine/threonine-protein kinase